MSVRLNLLHQDNYTQVPFTQIKTSLTRPCWIKFGQMGFIDVETQLG